MISKFDEFFCLFVNDLIVTLCSNVMVMVGAVLTSNGVQWYTCKERGVDLLI